MEGGKRTRKDSDGVGAGNKGVSGSYNYGVPPSTMNYNKTNGSLADYGEGRWARQDG